MELLLSLHKREQPSFERCVFEAWSRAAASGGAARARVKADRA